MAFTAFGGPQAHIAMMLDFLVSKRKYLTEAELIELNALCQMLPGPTSTQTITAIGYKLGGPKLATLTVMIWAAPAVIVMSLFSFLIVYFNAEGFSTDFLKFIPAMAVGFITVAAYKIGKKVVFDPLTWALLIVSTALAYFFRQPWVFPLILVGGGIISNLIGKQEGASKKVSIKPRWTYLLVFFGVYAGAEVLAYGVGGKPFLLFEHFYRFGSLIFGGGQVLIPFIQGTLVDHEKWMTDEEFLNGFGIIQGLPGPVFSFSAYAGGLSLRDGGTLMQLLGCFLGVTGLFMPGVVLIFFVYPLWEDLKQLTIIKRSLKGVNAAAAGLVASAAIVLFLSLGLDITTVAIVVGTCALLILTKIPSPAIVAAMLIAGFLF